MSTPAAPPPPLHELQSRTDYLEAEQQRRRRGRVMMRLLIWAGVAWALAATTILAYGVVQVRHTQIDGTPKGKQLVTASNRILDCTNVDGKCTLANQKRLAGQIQGLVMSSRQAAADAAACGAQPDVAAIQPIAARADAVFTCMSNIAQVRESKLKP